MADLSWAIFTSWEFEIGLLDWGTTKFSHVPREAERASCGYVEMSRDQRSCGKRETNTQLAEGVRETERELVTERKTGPGPG